MARFTTFTTEIPPGERLTGWTSRSETVAARDDRQSRAGGSDHAWWKTYKKEPEQPKPNQATTALKKKKAD